MNDKQSANKIATLAASPFFANLEPGELAELAGCSHVTTVKAKGTAFRKGTPGNQMFAIIRGRVKISTLSDEGKEVIFSILEPGDVFGEVSLLDGRERTAAVHALQDSELLVIERGDFLPFLEKNPKVCIKVLAALCKRLRMADELVEDVVFLDFPSRLAKKLLHLARDYGRQCPAGICIGCKLSQTELGNMVGTSRESVNKQIRAWEDEGIISVDRGYITLTDRSKLETLVR